MKFSFSAYGHIAVCLQIKYSKFSPPQLFPKKNFQNSRIPVTTTEKSPILIRIQNRRHPKTDPSSRVGTTVLLAGRPLSRVSRATFAREQVDVSLLYYICTAIPARRGSRFSDRGTRKRVIGLGSFYTGAYACPLYILISPYCCLRFWFC